VRATYRLHDRLLSNRASRRKFADEQPALDEIQQRIVADLASKGFSLVRFEELFSAEELAAITAQAQRFAEETAAGLAGDGEQLRVRPGKEFVVRLHSYDSEIGPDDPWFRICASRRMLDIANSYVGMLTKLEYVDVWYSVPQDEGARRVASQRWHRDFNDQKLVKAFLYLVDVDEQMGPFEYVPGSTGDGPYSDVWAWEPLGESYPNQREFAERFPEATYETFTGAKGSLIFCDTSGFHRGGLSTTDPRILATVTYSSPASLAALTERNFRYTGSLDALDETTRFALS
jgi:ectoine hydroxylase-related dioxygenase (phytanoyl-CoA dioxygenase family)